jgi:O-acetyl-ADP-ribose deacetylase (regulator of RNase III)
MTHFPQSDANRRAPRLQLNGSVAAAIHAEGGQRARAKLQSISITGGLLQVQHELSTGDFVELAFHSRSGPIHAMAEMLPPARKLQSACLQPFRFVAIGDDDHRKLRMALDSAMDHSALHPVSGHFASPPF